VKTQSIAVWIGLAAFALGVAGVTALGRLGAFLGESPAQPMSERYIIHASLFWIAIVALGVHNLRLTPQPGRLRNYGRLLRIFNVVALVVLSVFYTDAAVRTTAAEPFPPLSAEVCYRAYVEAGGSTDCFWQFYPPMFPQVPERIALYEQYRFAGASSSHE
jgi:hypothetical protein